MVATPARVNYLDSLRENTVAMATAARKAGLDTAVPSCQGWTVADLVRHTAEVFTWCDAVVRERGPIDSKALPRMPNDDTVVDEFERRASTLIDALTALPEDEPVWNWTGGEPIAGYYHRRMAQELTIHRYDAEFAAGSPGPIDAAMAVDGIEEVLTMLVAQPRAGRNIGGSLRVCATDTECDWVIEIVDGNAKLTPGAQADATARGPGSDLLLFLWNRKAASDLDTAGAAEILKRWAETVKL